MSVVLILALGLPTTGSTTLTCVSGGYWDEPATYLDTTECYSLPNMRWEIFPSLQLPSQYADINSWTLGWTACLGGGMDGLVKCVNRTAIFAGSGDVNSTGSAWIDMPPILVDRWTTVPIYGPGWIGLAAGSVPGFEITTPSWFYGSGQEPSTSLGPLQWSEISFPVTPTQKYPINLVLNGTVCLFGGDASNNSTKHYVNNSHCLIGDLSTILYSNLSWADGPNLTYARLGSMPLVVAGLSCIAGGSNGAYQNTIECANTSASWDSIGRMQEIGLRLPLVVAWAKNLSLFGLQCMSGGEVNVVGFTKDVWCLNASAQVDESQWIWMAMPPLNVQRGYHSPFSFSLDPAPTTAPTMAPTTSPTLSPTTSPTTSPTMSPTIAPTLAPTFVPQGWWRANYPTVLLPNQWGVFTVFTIANPPQGVPSLGEALWSFTNSNITGTGSTFETSPFTFIPGISYSGQVVIGTTAQNFNFYVAYSPLVAVITGGNQDIPAHSTLALDASSSQDPNLPPSVPPSTVLSGVWTSTCVSAVVVPSTINSLKADVHTGSPETCTVTLNLTSVYTGLQRSQQAVAQLVIVTDVLYNITISGPDTISASDTLKLLATITTTATPATNFLWSAAPPILSSCAFPPVASSSASRAFSLPSSCLQPGQLYQFTFSAGTGAVSNQAVHSVLVQPTPAGGSCTISPTTGTAVSTMFTIICTNWATGSDLAYLQYSVAIHDAVITAGNNIGDVMITDSFTQNNISLLLPQLTASQSLVVYIQGLGNAITVAPVSPSIVITPNTAQPCPLNSAAVPFASPLTPASINALLVAMLEFFNDFSISTCPQSVINTTEYELWNTVLRLTAAKAPADDVRLAYLATILDLTLKLGPPVNDSALDFSTNLLEVLEYFVANDASPVVIGELFNSSIPTAFTILSGNCTATNALSLLVKNLIHTGTSGNLPSDGSFNTNAAGLSVSSGVYFSGSQNIVVNGGGGTVVGASGLLSQTSDSNLDLASLTVTEYGPTLQKCRNDNGNSNSNDPRLIASGRVVDITLTSSDGQPIVVTPTAGKTFSFLLPANNMQRCGEVACAWWNETQQAWKNSGCTTTTSADDPTIYVCTCNHLTEFALLLSPEDCLGYQTEYLVLLGLNGVLVLVIAFKLAARFYAEGINFKVLRTPVVAQHLLMLVLEITRVLTCISLGTPMSNHWNLTERAVTIVLPYLVMFWLYTSLVFQWASLHHFGMKYRFEAFAQVKTLFIVSNFLICGAMIALVSSLGVNPRPASLTSPSPPSSKDQIALGATATLAAITFITAVAFFVYAVSLYRSMSGNDSKSANKSCSELRTRVLLGGCTLCVLLCLEGAMHIQSVVAQRAAIVGSPTGAVGANVSEIVMLVADWACVIVLLALYHRSMANSVASTSVKRMRSNVEMSEKTHKETVSHKATI